MTLFRQDLLDRATGLCQAFSSHKPIDDILHYLAPNVVCFEHGLLQLAPFLGRPFVGHEGAQEYFTLINGLLEFDDMAFSDYMVDTETRQVSVRGNARFLWKSNNQAWSEVFVYRLKFDKDLLITEYHVWADTGAAYLASNSELQVGGKRIVLISYEFTYSTFSGNGILARSLVKSLLYNWNCQVTIWCCKPPHDEEETHIMFPEISKEAQSRLKLVPVSLSEGATWKKLDDESAWKEFVYDNVPKTDQGILRSAVSQADAVCVIDWTGAHAYKSIPSTTSAGKPLIYMNFRVYSSGVTDVKRQGWFDYMESKALQDAKYTIALSDRDQASLEKIRGRAFEQDSSTLLPPLRGDMQLLADKSADELDQYLPDQVRDALLGDEDKILITCVARLSPEKNVLRFVRLIQKLQQKVLVIPLLAGAASDANYAYRVKQELLQAAPNAIIVDTFLSPNSLAAIFSRTALNFHPCAYDAYGMTIVEAAACGVPSVLAKGGTVGASKLIGSEACLEVDMPADDTLPGYEAVSTIEKLLFQDTDELKRLGQAAKGKALAWDEIAYGKAWLGVLGKLEGKVGQSVQQQLNLWETLV